jgi:hypothetical protein
MGHFHAIRFARKGDAAVALGIVALKDRATIVRYSPIARVGSSRIHCDATRCWNFAR